MNTISRRRFVKVSLSLSVLSTTVGSALFSARSHAGDLICTDSPTLTDQERKQRASQHYVDASPLGEKKNCANCAVYQPGSAAACGTCLIVPGPIHPLGYCDAWTDMN